MMEVHELKQLIRETVKRELAQIMMCNITDTADTNRGSMQRFANEGVIDNLRIIHPYGFASRPPTGMAGVAVPIASDPTHLNLIGQYDSNRPAINKGESVLYGPDGQVVYMKSGGSIHQGILGAASPVVLGDILQVLMDGIFNAILQAPQIGQCAVGPVVLDPSIRSELQNLQTEYVDTTSTNFLGQKNFVDRGV